MLDVVIVGGGAAGLSAALVLGRMRRHVLVVDSSKPRNAPAHGVHGFFSRDGIPPQELLRIGREQLAPYSTVTLVHAEVTAVTRTQSVFEVELADGSRYTSKKILLATGVRDQLPEIEGLADLWGKSVFHCPYCHGWEARDRAIAILANGEAALHLASLLRSLSTTLVICTNGVSEIDLQQQAQLDIPIFEKEIIRLNGNEGQLQEIVFSDGSVLECEAVFVRTTQQQHSDLASRLGCSMSDMGYVQVNEQGQTTVEGVYAAGDLVSPMQQVIHAASRGAHAAAMLNHELAKAVFEPLH